MLERRVIPNMDHKAFLAIGLAGTALLCSVALVLEFPQLLVVVLLLLAGVAITWLGAVYIKTLQTLNMQGRILTGLSELHPVQSSPEVIYQIQKILQRLFPTAQVQIYPGPANEVDPVIQWEQASSWAQQSVNAGRVLILTGQEEGLNMPTGVENLAVLPLQGPDPQALLLINAAQSSGAKNLQAVLEILRRHVAVVLDRLQEQEQQQDLAQSLLTVSITAMESHQPTFNGHAKRVARISRLIGQRLGMSRKELTFLAYAALLHDIGKWVLSEDSELNHASLGADLIPAGKAFADIEAAIRYHHERYDGSGYPEGLHHTEIPLAARIIAVADVYDALTKLAAEEERCDHGLALAGIKRGIGTRFDPLVVVAFEEVAAEIE
jgi:hypothetical protein